MADSSSVNLYRELTHRFPELPEYVVTDVMKQNHNIRDRCFIALGRESEKYLYGADLSTQVNNLQLTFPDSRQRSTSASSQSSAGNNNSLSNISLTPPKQLNHSHSTPLVSNAGAASQQYAGRPGAQEPQTAPAYNRGQFAPFLTHSISTSEQTLTSPGIPCSVFIPGNSYGGVEPGAGSHQQGSPHSGYPHHHQQHVIFQRPQSQFTEHFGQHGGPSPGSVSQSDMSPASAASLSGQFTSPRSNQPFTASMQYQTPTSWSYRQGITVQSNPPARPSQFVHEFPNSSPEGRRDSPSYDSPQRGTPTQHHSQLDLQPGVSIRPYQNMCDHVNPAVTQKRASYSPTTPGHMTAATTPSPNYKTQAYIHLNPKNNNNAVTPSSGMSLPSPGQPLHAGFYMSGQQPHLVVSQDTNSSGQPLQTFTISNIGGQWGVTPANTATHPYNYDQNNANNVNVMGMSNSEMLSVLQPALPPMLSSSPGVVSLASGDPGMTSPGDMQGRTSRSGSLVGGTEDMAYLQALILHQKARMEKIVNDLEKQTSAYQGMQTEVSSLENEVYKRRRAQDSRFPTKSDIQKLRDENGRLRVDIQLMAREVDMHNNGEMPLGVVDPMEQQHFYRNIDPGQQVPGTNQVPGMQQTANPLRPLDQHTSLTPRPPAHNSHMTYVRAPPPLPMLPPVGGWTRHSFVRYVPPTPVLPGYRPAYPPPPVPPRQTPPPAPSRPPSRPAPPPPPQDVQWSCTACTFLNHQSLDRCEICEMPRLGQGGAR